MTLLRRPVLAVASLISTFGEGGAQSARQHRQARPGRRSVVRGERSERVIVSGWGGAGREVAGESLDAQGGVARAHEVEELVAVLADEWLDVVTRHVVPLDAVVVEVVEDRQARLVITLQ